MRKVIIILVLGIVGQIHSGFSQDSNYTELNNLNFEYYLNKPIDSLLIAIPPFVSSQLKVFGYADNFKARCLAVIYPNQLVLKIRTKKFQFMNPIDPNQIWDVSLFKKETAWFIELFYQGIGIKNAGPN